MTKRSRKEQLFLFQKAHKSLARLPSEEKGAYRFLYGKRTYLIVEENPVGGWDYRFQIGSEVDQGYYVSDLTYMEFTTDAALFGSQYLDEIQYPYMDKLVAGLKERGYHLSKTDYFDRYEWEGVIPFDGDESEQIWFTLNGLAGDPTLKLLGPGFKKTYVLDCEKPVQEALALIASFEI